MSFLVCCFDFMFCLVTRPKRSCNGARCARHISSRWPWNCCGVRVPTLCVPWPLCCSLSRGSVTVPRLQCRHLCLRAGGRKLGSLFGAVGCVIRFSSKGIVHPRYEEFNDSWTVRSTAPAQLLRNLNGNNAHGLPFSFVTSSIPSATKDT